MYTLFGKCNLCFHSPVKLSRAVKMAPGRTTTSTPVMLRGFTSSTVSHLKTSSLSQFNTSFMNHIRTSPVCHLRKAPKSVYRIFVSIYCESIYYYNKKYKWCLMMRSILTTNISLNRSKPHSLRHICSMVRFSRSIHLNVSDYNL